jgi:hypothetical protein
MHLITYYLHVTYELHMNNCQQHMLRMSTLEKVRSALYVPEVQYVRASCCVAGVRELALKRTREGSAADEQAVPGTAAGRAADSRASALGRARAGQRVRAGRAVASLAYARKPCSGRKRAVQRARSAAGRGVGSACVRVQQEQADRAWAVQRVARCGSRMLHGDRAGRAAKRAVQRALGQVRAIQRV